MKFTIITVCFNSEKYILDCIESVRQQTYADFEHWIIDGASKDGTVAKIQKGEHPNLQWISEPDQGLYFAMNKGLERATGDVIGFLNADDFYAHTGVLARVAAELADPAYQGTYSDLEYVDEHNPTEVTRYWQAGIYKPGLFRRGWMPPHLTFFARREVYEKFGGFDTTFRIGADWDLLLRMMEVNRVPCAYIPEVLIRMRRGGVSNSSLKNILRNNRECLRAFGKYRMRPSVLYPFAKLAHRLPQFFAKAKM